MFIINYPLRETKKEENEPNVHIKLDKKSMYDILNTFSI